MPAEFETVIGLEVHAEMNTASKIFCGCETAFGGEPNTHCCPVCMGLPGALPVFNGGVAEKAILAGLSLGCEITRETVFDRKNYFYPDLPKAYQISQLYHPICQGGGIELASGRFIRLREIHMEEDAGKLIHDPWTESTLADYNRCGVPLMEIVTQPDLRSPEEVIEFMQSLKSILEYAGVTDGKMHEGSLRADLNISVRRPGEGFGTRTEMKNMNSFKAIQRAVTVESERQIALIKRGERVLQETRRWDDNRDLSYPMRSKENAQDYRYFPEPDLPALHIDEGWLNEACKALPELPKAKRERYFAQFVLPRHDVEILCQTHALTVLLERTAEQGASPKDAANWILSDVLRLCREREIEPAELQLAPKALAEIIAAVNGGRVNRSGGRALLEHVLAGEKAVEAAIAELGLELAGDENALGASIAEVLAENPDAVANYRAGKVKVLGFLAGQCMQKLKGRADPRRVSELLREELAK